MNEPTEREETVFEAARQLPLAQRAEYLDRACAHDPELRQRVEGLLGAFERATGFLKESAVSAPSRSLIPVLTSDQVGEKIGRYKLLQRLGEGGCGVVFMAEQEEPVQRRVALKIIKPGMDTKSLIARFEAERQALAMMDHPNIAKFFDAGVTETGRPYFVMELVRGTKITEYCDQNRLDTRARLDLFIQICRAVQHAHQKGIIHRDIKPSNILITLHDGMPVPKVIDFGIAKAMQGHLTDQTVFTAFEQFIGTPAYMSPEQAELSGLDIDTRSDIYSLGVLLYELLTGRTPFNAKELLAAGLDKLREAIREREPVRPSTRLSTMMAGELDNAAKHRRIEAARLVNLLRRDLDWIVLKCLEKDRTRRYETANGLAMDISRYLNSEPIVARPPSAVYRFQKLVRRNKLAFVAATIVTATLLLGAIVSTWQAVRARQAERTARLEALKATTESARALDAESRARQESESAQREQRRANASLYAANMRLAQYAWAQNSAGQIRQLLDETEGYPGRGFEWFYWQRQTHLQLETLRGHQTAVLSVAWSPDRRWILTGSWDRTANLWESVGGRKRRTFLHDAAIMAVAFSPDSQRIATGGQERSVKVWELATGKLLLNLKGHTGDVFAVAFSPDGQRIVTGSMDHSAKVWDATTGQEQLTLRGHTHWVWSAAFSHDARWIVTGSHDGTAKVWDASTGVEVRAFSEHTGPIHSVAWSPVARQVASAGQDLTVRVWDPASGRELFPPLRGHVASIYSVAFSPDGQRLATGSFDQAAKVWDAAGGRELFTVRHGSPISSVAFSADGQRLVTGGGYIGISPLAKSIHRGLGDNTAKIWAASGDQETLSLAGHTSRVVAVAFSPDGRRVLTGGFDKTAFVWDAETGKALFRLTGHNDVVRAVAFSPDARRIVTGSLDGTARIWSASGERVLAELTGHRDKVFGVAFSPDGQWVATGSADGTARLWSAVDGRQLATYEVSVDWIFSLAFSPDGQRIAIGSSDRTASIWDAATGKRLRVLEHARAVMSVAFSPDGQRIVTGSQDGTARIWELSDDRKPPLILPGHSIEIFSVAFSSDGRRVVTGGKDGAAKVWDATSGRELLTLSGHADAIWAVAFSPDGRRLVTGSWDGTAKIWQAASEEQVLQWRAETLDRQQQPGAIRRWLVLSPLFFPHKDGARALQDEQLAGESLLRPRIGQRIKAGGSELLWQPVELDVDEIDFNKIAGLTREFSVAYAVCYIVSEGSHDGVSVGVGSDDQARIYLNGELIYESAGRRSYIPDEHVVTGQKLKAGSNVLIFKVVNESGNWRGSIRLNDSDGNPLQGIQVTLDPSLTGSKPQARR